MQSESIANNYLYRRFLYFILLFKTIKQVDNLALEDCLNVEIDITVNSYSFDLS